MEEITWCRWMTSCLIHCMWNLFGSCFINQVGYRGWLSCCWYTMQWLGFFCDWWWSGLCFCLGCSKEEKITGGTLILLSPRQPREYPSTVPCLCDSVWLFFYHLQLLPPLFCLHHNLIQNTIILLSAAQITKQCGFFVIQPWVSSFGSCIKFHLSRSWWIVSQLNSYLPLITPRKEGCIVTLWEEWNMFQFWSNYISW